MKICAVAKIKPQPRQQAIDRVVDALAAVWNESGSDDTAYWYFYQAEDERAQMLSNSIGRYPERDAQLIARKLLELADAIYGAVGPWV